jgi:hypothetical protein
MINLVPIDMKTFILVACITIVSINAFSQGCSDAGFCTMGAMKPDQPYNKRIALKLRSMELSFYRGTTTLAPIVYVATADLNFSLNSRNSFQVKLPYQAVSGEGTLATTSGLGDISLCYTRSMFRSDQFDINMSFGGKIPSNHSDKSVDGLPLPMYYQTSLGTYDVISGISLINRKWLFATGIQIPLNKNRNDFLWGAWSSSDKDPNEIKEYPKSKALLRGIDVMFRVERNFRFSKFNFSLGLLPIYRVTNDEITNALGEREKPDGARGLALSGISTLGYNFNVRSGIKLLVGRKFVQREENPDGLTRHSVCSITYNYRF